MKCVTLLSNAQIEVQEKPIPSFKEDECLVKIAYAGICSSDIPRAFMHKAYFYPLVMGHELSGTVVEIGSDVQNFNINDKVTLFPLLPCNTCSQCVLNQYQRCSSYQYYGSRCDGGYAEYLAVKKWNLLKLPAAISLKDAALFEPSAVVVNALRKIVFTNKKVLVIGAGFMSRILLDLFKDNPKEVFIADRNVDKLTSMPKNVQEIHIGDQENIDKFLKNYRDYFDVVFELTGSKEIVPLTIQVAGANSKIILVGNVSGDVNIPEKLFSSILRKELSIKGTWNSTFYHSPSDDWHTVMEHMKNTFFPSKHVSHYINLEDVPVFLEKIHKRREFPLSPTYVIGLIKIDYNT